MATEKDELDAVLHQTFDRLGRVLEAYRPALQVSEVGTVQYVGQGVVLATGLSGVRAEELLRFPGDRLGLAFNLDEKEIGIVLLDTGKGLVAGTEVERTGQVVSVAVGDGLLGRVVDPTGRPLDGRGPVRGGRQRPVERPAPAIMDRAPVTVPLHTGIKAVDALIPIGRGQRELILGDRQTGKTAIAVDTMINQRDKNVVCIYCGIGKQAAAVAKVIADLQRHGAMDNSVVMVTTEADPPGMQYVAPYGATTMGEFFMEQGKDVLVVFDDLTRHARAYRELSLLLRRPPGREAFPGDIFFIHSRLLERATHLCNDLGGGSLTALPIVETEAQNLSAYIPTNLISITDGQIYLSPELFQKGNLPAVDVGKSVSRVGGKTQLAAYRVVAGDLRLSYSQFEELEAFSRFGTRLDEVTRKTLERGRRVREILKQPQYRPMPVSEQIASLVAVTRGLLDDVPLKKVGAAEAAIREVVTRQLAELCDAIERGKMLSDIDLKSLERVGAKAVGGYVERGKQRT